MAANVVEIVVRSTDQTGEGFDKAKAGADEAGAGMDEYAAATERASKAEQEFRDAQAQAADAQSRLDEMQSGGTASAGEMAAAQDKLTMATLRSLDAQRALGTADLELAAKERLAGDAAELQGAKTEESAGVAGLAAGGLEKFGMIGGLALGAVGYEAVKMSMNFQAAMERLVTQAGVPAKMLAPLKTGILSLAGAVGFSPESLSESLYHVASNMASLGASAPRMLSMVKIAAEGAAVGGANLEDVTNALTAAVASGIPGVQNFGQAMGALNAIVGAGDMKMQDLASAMGTGVLATVKGYGLSLKDVGAALDVFGDNNIRGSHAATELGMAVQALAKPAAAGKAALAGVGLSMTNLRDKMRSDGLLAALEDLQAHFKKAGVTAKEQGGEITDIFGKKAGTGLNVLMDQMDRLKSKYPAITEGASKFGEAWKKTQGTAKQQFDELKSTVDSLMVSVGERLLPVVQKLASFLLRNKGIIDALTPAILAIVGAFTLLKVVMAAIEVISDLSPWMIAIMGIVLAATLLVEHWKEVKKVAEDVFRAVESAVKEVWNWIKDHWGLIFDILTGPVGMAVKWIVEHWKQITDGARSMYDDVTGFFKRLPHDILTALGDLGHLLWGAGVSIIKGLIGGITSMVGSVEHTVSGVVDDIKSFLPFSPAKKGPMSGSGSPETSGRQIAAMLAHGMDSGRGAVSAAAARMAGAAGTSAGPAGHSYGGGGGGGDIVFRLGSGGSGIDQLFMTWLKNAVRSGGGDPAIFTRKVQFK